VRCRRYLAGRLPFAPRPVSTTDLAHDLRSAAPAVNLHGGHLEVEASGLPAAVTVDLPLITAAVHGLAWALLALGETAGDPRVRISVAGVPAAIKVVQPTVVLNQPMLLRFFDPAWKGRPGGTTAELAVQVARHAAARHGANLEVSSGAGVGTTIAITLP
jgi:signal transduction histidine kinase